MGHADVGHIGVCQATGKTHVQPDLAAVRLCCVVTDQHIARANVAQAGQFSLYLDCELGAVCGVADVARGLATKAECEAAPRYRLHAAEVDHHHVEIHPDQRPAKSDLVAARNRAADLYSAIAA